MQALILMRPGQDLMGLGLQGLDLLSDHLQLRTHAAGDHLVGLLDFPCQVDQSEPGRQAADGVGRAVVGALMDQGLIPSVAVCGHD